MDIMRRGSILKKIVIILVLCFLAPFLYQAFQINVTVNNMVKDKVTNTAQKGLENSAMYISSIFQAQFDTVNYYRNDSKIIDIASRLREAAEQEKYQIKESIDLQLTSGNNLPRYKYPSYFIVMDYRGSMMTNYTFSPFGNYEEIYKEIAGKSWFSALRDSYTSKTVMFSDRDFLNTKGTEKFYVASNIVADGNTGILVIAADEASIASSFYDVLPEGSSFIVTPEGECIIQFSDGKIDYNEALAQQIRKDSGEIKIGKEKYTVIEAPVAVQGYSEAWKLLSVVPTETLKEDVNKISRLNNVVLVLYIVAIMWVIWLLNRSIVKPIREIRCVVNQVREGDFHVQAEHLPDNELGELGEGFNIMTQYLNQYFTDVKQNEERKRITEFRLLQSQIKPHFVRNVLNTIRWLAEINGISSVSRSVMALSNLLEYNFQDSSLTTTVKEELEYVKTYLYLQKIRFQNKFKDEYDIEEAVLDMPILKLSFQPVVENCIYHGLLNKEGLGTIRIIGREKRDCMEIMICDNGVGMEQEQADNILKPPEEADIYVTTEGTENIALWNVNQRLKRRYGEAYGLKIFSKPGEGTRVVLYIPVEEDTID